MYWLLALLVTGFGFISALSIGQPFLLLGLALLVLGPWRRRARVFWPVILGVVGFDLGFMLTAPWICAATSTITSLDLGSSSVGPSVVECQGLLGSIRLPVGVTNPSLEPAFRTGLATAFIAATGTAGVQAIRARSGRNRA